MSRFGNDGDEWRALSAKLLAVFAVTQSGTQFIYQGQELGLRNFPRNWDISEYKDVVVHRYYDRSVGFIHA